MRKSFFLLATLALGGCNGHETDRVCRAMLKMARSTTDSLIAYAAKPSQNHMSCATFITPPADSAHTRAGASR